MSSYKKYQFRYILSRPMLFLFVLASVLTYSGINAYSLLIPADINITYSHNIALSALLPTDTTTDSYGNMYITSSENGDGIGHVVKVSSSGTFLDEIGSSGPGVGQFSIGSGGSYGPGAIALDLSGNIYVTDLGLDRTLTFDPEGDFITYLGTPSSDFDEIGYVSVSPDGNIFVSGVDSGDSMIKKYDRFGNFVTQFDDYSLSNLFSGGMSFDYNNNIYIANTNDETVSKISTSGNLLLRFGNSGAHQLSTPTDVSVDVANNIIVSNFISNSIMKFDETGNFISEYVSPWGNGAGEFQYIYSVTADNQGHILVPDLGESRIVVLNDATFSVPSGLDSDNDGVSDSAEAGAPNNGDGNNDGLSDKFQTKVTSNSTTVLNAYSTLINVGCSENDSVNSISPSDLQETDSQYEYPYGLIDFNLKCTINGSAQIEAVLFTDDDASQFVLRKYIANNNSYVTVDSAVITNETINGHPAVKAVYTLVDGGQYDDDEVANGLVVDPVGFAVEQASPSETIPSPLTQKNQSNVTGSLPATGYNAVQLAVYSILLCLVGMILMLSSHLIRHKLISITS